MDEDSVDGVDIVEDLELVEGGIHHIKLIILVPHCNRDIGGRWRPMVDSAPGLSIGWSCFS